MITATARHVERMWTARTHQDCLEAGTVVDLSCGCVLGHVNDPVGRANPAHGKASWIISTCHVHRSRHLPLSSLMREAQRLVSLATKLQIAGRHDEALQIERMGYDVQDIADLVSRI